MKKLILLALFGLALSVYCLADQPKEKDTRTIVRTEVQMIHYEFNVQSYDVIVVNDIQSESNFKDIEITKTESFIKPVARVSRIYNYVTYESHKFIKQVNIKIRAIPKLC